LTFQPAAPEFTWQGTGLVGYDFGKRFTVFAGYGPWRLDGKRGGSTQKGVDLTFQGAVFGLNIRFSKT